MYMRHSSPEIHTKTSQLQNLHYAPLLQHLTSSLQASSPAIQESNMPHKIRAALLIQPKVSIINTHNSLISGRRAFLMRWLRSFAQPKFRSAVKTKPPLVDGQRSHQRATWCPVTYVTQDVPKPQENTWALKDVGMLDEAPLNPPVIHPSVIRSVRHIIPPLRVWLRVWHYSFLPGWGWWEVGGEVFFFKVYLVRRVDSPCPLGQWTFHASLFGRGGGGRIYFPFNQWEGSRCLAF